MRHRMAAYFNQQVFSYVSQFRLGEHTMTCSCLRIGPDPTSKSFKDPLAIRVRQRAHWLPERIIQRMSRCRRIHPGSPVAILGITRLTVVGRFAQDSSNHAAVDINLKAVRKIPRLEKKVIQFVPPIFHVAVDMIADYEESGRTVIALQYWLCRVEVVGVPIVECDRYGLALDFPFCQRRDYLMDGNHRKGLPQNLHLLREMARRDAEPPWIAGFIRDAMVHQNDHL